MKKDDLGYIKEPHKMHNSVIVVVLIIALLIAGVLTATKLKNQTSGDSILSTNQTQELPAREVL